MIILWPFAAKCSEERMNNLTIDLDCETPDMKFSSVKAVNVKLKHYHTFGCPVYILDSKFNLIQKVYPNGNLDLALGFSTKATLPA